jgi:hypothetical protein
VDAGGLVIDVLFDEDVVEAYAADPLNWAASGAQVVTSAEALAGNMFRISLSAPLAGGDTLDLNGLPDPAGNVSGPISIAPVL